MKKYLLTLMIFSIVCTVAAAQQAFKWPGGKTSAIVLTYDDAMETHLQIAIPQLHKAGLKGTFFLCGFASEDELVEWQKAAKQGHEMANHSLYHACAQNPDEKPKKESTENYDVPMMLKEIGMMNKLLFGIDGKKPRTYAYPCAQTLAGGVDYVDALKNSGIITYARIGGDKNAIVTDFGRLDFLRVPSWGITENPTGKELIEYVKKVSDVQGLGVLMFHGVGGQYLSVTAEAHQELLKYLAENIKDVWVGTFQQVLDYVKSNTVGSKK